MFINPGLRALYFRYILLLLSRFRMREFVLVTVPNGLNEQCPSEQHVDQRVVAAVLQRRDWVAGVDFTN